MEDEDLEKLKSHYGFLNKTSIMILPDDLPAQMGEILHGPVPR